ncbi:cell wall glycosyl hydrolase [Moniliophthora roreri MCA 2997]|uniref:Cell wall glycosyl hydrolase n=2 Tax=Moniliophthora roreri TaxID=221103 RepID=V2YJL6_MONRO|nr:cell wall glycosyl hydrolase [Moniliophthora roreri MCA 2997]KAI3604965.1 cell wall glycosyl hydrolase [Moniliophthora roreri]
MIIFLPVLGFATLSFARPSSYAVWAADSIIARGQGNGLDSSGNALVSYEHGEFQWGLRQLFERTRNQTYYDYILDGVNNVVTGDGIPHGSYVLSDYSLDPLRVGPSFLYLYNTTQDTKYKQAADVFRSQLATHPRTAQGQLWHKKRYFNQGWLDGIYMGDIFYAQYTAAFQPDNTTAWADITNQFHLMFENTLQNASSAPGLLYHGYDFSHTAVWASPDRGHSPEVWDRALGWYMMALVDILEIIPGKNPGYATILQILQTLAPHVRDAADPQSGVWWLVMSQPGRERNYFESSGSAMFVYSLLKAVRLGFVADEDGSIVAAAQKAYGYLIDNFVTPKGDGTFDWEGTVIVGSLDQTGTFDYYVSQKINLNDLKGAAAFLLASLEMEIL